MVFMKQKSIAEAPGMSWNQFWTPNGPTPRTKIRKPRKPTKISPAIDPKSSKTRGCQSTMDAPSDSGHLARAKSIELGGQGRAGQVERAASCSSQAPSTRANAKMGRGRWAISRLMCSSYVYRGMDATRICIGEQGRLRLFRQRDLCKLQVYTY